MINALFLTGYFLAGKRTTRYANVYLGLLLLALVIRIGKSVFFYFDSNLNQVYILIGLLGCMAIGPMCYYFTRSQISGKKHFDPRSLLHLIPLVLLSVYAFFFVSYNENRWLWSNYIVRGIYVYWGLYALYSGFLVLRERYIRKQRFDEDAWTQGVVLGVLLIWLAYFTSSFTSYLTGAISFSFLVYLLAGILIHQLRKKPSKRSKAVKALNWSAAEVEEIKTKLKEVLVQQERYKDPELTMPDLAKELGLTAHQLSFFINEHFGQNYPQLVNTYRVEASSKMLLEEPQLTVEAIGFDCGFNSPSTFHTAFKKVTGKTPAAFRRQGNSLPRS